MFLKTSYPPLYLAGGHGPPQAPLAYPSLVLPWAVTVSGLV